MQEKIIYCYENSLNQFSFLKLPHFLFMDPMFKDLSNDAKLLYAMMLERISLSKKNNWIDEDGRVYIIFAIEQVKEILNCSKSKALKIMDELKDDVKLIEKVRRGQGKPDIIYVKVPVENVSEVSNENFKKSENETSRSMNKKTQEVQKENPNKNNSNNIKFNKTNLIHLSESNGNDEMDDYQSVYDYVKDIVDYDALIITHPNDKELYDSFVMLISEILYSKQPYVRINGDLVESVLVKNRFHKLTYSSLEYAAETLNENITNVKNVRSYILTTLYNSVATIDAYYRLRVNYDLYGKEAG